MTTLTDYQLYGVGWMVTREESTPMGGFLCDEMGLGKTIQVIYLMKLKRVQATLIVVPNSLVDQWIAEIFKFSKLTVSMLEDCQNTDVVITTYSKFVPKCTLFPELFKRHWDRVILDEGHEIRTAKSIRYKNICLLDTPRRWILTGTPIYNKRSDYDTLRKWVTGGSSSIHGSLILRRTKKSVGLDIPQCVFENCELEMYPDEWERYCQTFYMYQGMSLDGMTLLEALLRVRQLSIHPSIFDVSYTGRSKKMDTIIENIQGHPREKSIVFSQFHKEMDILQGELESHGVPVYRLDGSVPMEERDSIVQGFKTNMVVPSPVFIIQIKTGGQGLNLQEATRVYITSPSWNPASEVQAIGRAHRKGQTKTVHVKKMVYTASDSTAQSIDEAIIALQGAKSEVYADVLKDPSLIHQIPSLRCVNPSQVCKIFSV
jgi:SNF2 family DNA or RNA helicase